jgi:hypothetical protein
MKKKSLYDEVKALDRFVRQISIEDWIICDMDEAIAYARSKGLEVYELSDEEKRMFVRMNMKKI